MPTFDPATYRPFAALLDLAIPSGEELYERIMGTIEPELVSGELPRLPERFQADTPEEAQTRAARYAQAFSAFEQKFAEEESALTRLVTAQSRHRGDIVEDAAKQHDGETLQDIATEIFKLP